MKRLRRLIVIFCVALSIPLGYFILRTYWSLEQEEVSELRYFADTLFDDMEEDLGALVVREEERAVDEYSYEYSPCDQGPIPGLVSMSRSPLSRLPHEPYILGHLQNNPDGSLQTPLVESTGKIPVDRADVVAQLNAVNETFNLKRTSVSERVETQPKEFLAREERKRLRNLAKKYLALCPARQRKVYLWYRKKRVEQLSVNRALSVAGQYRPVIPREIEQKARIKSPHGVSSDVIGGVDKKGRPDNRETRLTEDRSQRELWRDLSPDSDMLEVEVDPMQSVFVDDFHVFMFRRVVMNNQIYRQGLVIKVKELLNYLADAYFVGQPMAGFARLHLKVMDEAREVTALQAGAKSEHPTFSLDRTFPRPFSFLRASLTCDQLPRSAGRKTLNVMMTVLAAIMLLGLLAIYQSARAVVNLSKRRARFVSSVTHELKTPLTNIRMYIEMLEQGMAQDLDREQEYYRILGSESARLSRLINNVLEFSKLDRKQRPLNLREGTFEEVIDELKDIMQEKLRQEGFVLEVEKQDIAPFKYDREVMIQVLMNLIENSMKFGKDSPVRNITLRVWPDRDRINISVSDTGPGIPRHALKKVFDDFYRVEDSLTLATRGTGIGLALVKKFVTAMGGTVTAANHDGPGCTIAISLPA